MSDKSIALATLGIIFLFFVGLEILAINLKNLTIQERQISIGSYLASQLILIITAIAIKRIK